MQYISLGNPLWSGHVVMAGGWRRMFWNTSFYAAILFVGCAIGVKFEEFGPPRAAAAQTLNFLTYIQIFILYAMGSSARFKAMQRDHQSRMLESIRISPMRATTVVAGYVFGPIAQPLVNWLVGVVVGIGLIISYNLGGPRDWIVGNLLLLISVQTAWALQVFLSVGQKKAGNQAMFVYFACFFISRAVFTPFVIGTSIFLGLKPAMTSMALMRGAASWDKELAVGLLVSLIMTVFWWYAAAKRFRRSDLPALSVFGAMILCILWASCAVVGTQHALENYASGPLASGNARMIIKTMMMYLCGSLLIFAALPVSSATQILRIKILQLDDPLKRARSLVLPILLASFSVSIAAMALVVNRNLWDDSRFVDSTLILAATSLMFYGVIRLSCLRWQNSATGWTQMAAFWLLPVIISSVWRGIQISRNIASEHDPMGVTFTISPIGGLITSWTGVEAPVRTGIAVQFVVAVLAVACGLLAERSFRRSRVERLAESATTSSSVSGNMDFDYSVPSNSGEET